MASMQHTMPFVRVVALLTGASVPGFLFSWNPRFQSAAARNLHASVPPLLWSLSFGQPG